MQIGLVRVARLVAAAAGLALWASITVSSAVMAGSPAVSISPSSFNYGTVAVGSSATQAFVLTNTGTADLHLQGVSFTGANASNFRISIAGCDYRTVAAGATCTDRRTARLETSPSSRMGAPEPRSLQAATAG